MPGDDFRRIDWNALARFEKVFIKLFMEEQESPVTVFFDESLSMRMNNKKEVGVKVSAAFAYLALAEYDTTSLIKFSDGIDAMLSGLRGKSAFNQLVTVLEQEVSSTQKKDQEAESN